MIITIIIGSVLSDMSFVCLFPTMLAITTIQAAPSSPVPKSPERLPVKEREFSSPVRANAALAGHLLERSGSNMSKGSNPSLRQVILDVRDSD